MKKYFRGTAWAKRAYCKRPMRVDDPSLLPTQDHTHPRSKGGQHTVWACDTCNTIKGAMLVSEWTAFMRANPQWWKRRV